MTEERTVSDTGGFESTMTLDKHNPLGSVGSGITEKVVQITKIRIPSISRILNSRKPSINITAETQSSNEIDVELVLDEFSDTVDDDISLRSFCSSIGIEKKELYNLIDENIPLRISQIDGEISANLPKKSKTVEIESKDNSSQRFSQLCSLWKAKEYGKVRIVNIKQPLNGGFMCVVEIPWLSRTKKIRFDRQISGHPSFPSFYKNLVGRYPLNEEEFSSIVGKEIPLDYNGRLDLTDDMKQNIENENDSFSESLRNNYCRYKNKLSWKMLISDPISSGLIMLLIFGSLAFLPINTFVSLTLSILVSLFIILLSVFNDYSN